MTGTIEESGDPQPSITDKMPALALPFKYYRSTHLIHAIIFPPPCLLEKPDPSPPPPVCADRRLSSATQSSLQTLPAEIFLTICHSLTVTSRVNLALTSKRFANVLSKASGVVTLDARRLSSHTLQLLHSDESFQSWTPTLPTPRMLLHWTHRPRFDIIKHDEFDLRCDCCAKYIEAPTVQSSFRTVAGSEASLAFFDSLSPSEFEEYGHAMVTMQDRRCHEFCKEVFEHTQTSALRQGGGRLFTFGMFQLMDLYGRERIREQNIARAKRSVLSWEITNRLQG